MSEPLYCLYDSHRMNRRSFLLATSSLAAAALWSSRALGAIKRRPSFCDYPFQLGVASGDPTSDGVVLWTRLAPRPVEGGGMPAEPVEVGWRIGDDEAMTRVVKQGKTVATPAWAHSVHVEVNGLRPDRWYWYQFQAGNELSPKARTRTLPSRNSAPDRLRLAFASCQHYEAGYYTAYEHLAREELDLILHLGDYIYEGPAREGFVRRHNSGELFSLADYRNRHALYKTDPALQAAHAIAPWLVTWDDHEVDNNYANLTFTGKRQPGLTNAQRRAHAYQAYYEHMPLRRASLPAGPNLQLYRRLAYGRLADFFVLDTRQYRTDQPCGDGRHADCPGARDPKGTILGERQRAWLFRGLNQSRSHWNVLAQQVMMARVDLTAGPELGYSMDQWPGYEVDRRRVLKHFVEHRIANPIVLTGDIHSNWANELVADFDQLDSRVVGTEFVGTSISSEGDGIAPGRRAETLQAENPFVKFYNAQRGYVRCHVTPEGWRTDYRVVDQVSVRGAPVDTCQSFTVESGNPRLQST